MLLFSENMDGVAMYHRVLTRRADDPLNVAGYQCWLIRGEPPYFMCGRCAVGKLGPFPKVGEKCPSCDAEVVQAIVLEQKPAYWPFEDPLIKS